MSYPNEHITGMLDCIQKMQSFVPYVTDETEKQQFIAILSAMQGYAISARIHIQEKAEDVCLTNISFFCTERYTADIIEKNLHEAINLAVSKADACRRIMALETYGYILLSNVNDARKAELINPFAAPKYIFTEDDFSCARRKAK